jgi:hypothetical protein
VRPRQLSGADAKQLSDPSIAPPYLAAAGKSQPCWFTIRKTHSTTKSSSDAMPMTNQRCKKKVARSSLSVRLRFVRCVTKCGGRGTTVRSIGWLRLTSGLKTWTRTLLAIPLADDDVLESDSSTQQEGLAASGWSKRSPRLWRGSRMSEPTTLSLLASRRKLQRGLNDEPQGLAGVSCAPGLYVAC